MHHTSAWKNKLLVEAYLHGNRAAIPHAADQLNVMLHLLKHSERVVDRFLDLGAGDGILSQLILDQFPGTSACLVDFSEPMMEAAHRRLQGYADRVQLIQADLCTSDWLQQLPSDSKGTMDAVVSGFCIHHLPHPRKHQLYQEVYRLLAANGLFINMEHVASKSAWGEMLSEEAFIDSLLQHEATRPNPKTREEISKAHYAREDKKDNILLSLETQCEWLRQIGFAEVDVFFKSYELAVFAGKKR